MALGPATIFAVDAGGSDTANGGAFDPLATMATDLTATVATSSAPVVASASYNFVAGDVGHWLFIKSGTAWIPGWYQIASVGTPANAATLTATIGSAILYLGNTNTSTVAGCATTAGPSVGTWSIDYSQKTAPIYTYTDMVIGGTTTQFTSAAHPVGPNIVGNIIAITSGTGFTFPQRVLVSSVSGTTATCDKTLGTGASTGGNGGLGGALASPGMAGGLIVASSGVSRNIVHIKGGTDYSCSTSSNVAGGRITDAHNATWIGFASTRFDYGTKPIIKCGAASVTLFSDTVTGCIVDNLEFKGNSQTTSRGFFSDNGTQSSILRCKFNGFNNTAIYMDFSNGHWVHACEITACTTSASAVYLSGATGCLVSGCSVHDNSTAGLNIAGNTALDCIMANNSGASSVGIAFGQNGKAIGCTAYLNGSDGFDLTGNGARAINCVAYLNAGWGFNNSSAAGSTAFLINCASDAAHSGSVNYTNIIQAWVIGFITLTADPFTAKASNDFSLNATAGGGALLRSLAFPQSFPGLSTANYTDIGAADHVDPTAGGVPKLAGVGGGRCA